MTDRLVHLVRHGESTWNVLGRVQGQTAAPPLTERGRRQAAAAAAALAGVTAARLLTSDAVRARQTAAVVGRRLGLVPRPTPLLRERHWGVLQGRSLAEEREADRLLRDDQAVSGGESRAEVGERLDRLVGSPLLGDDPGPVVLVTHGDVITEALRRWGGRCPLDETPANGSVTTVWIDGRIDGRIERWNTPTGVFTPDANCAKVSGSCSAREAGVIPAWSSPL